MTVGGAITAGSAVQAGMLLFSVSLAGFANPLKWKTLIPTAARSVPGLDMDKTSSAGEMFAVLLKV